MLQERVRKLREEIAEINRLNKLHKHTPRPSMIEIRKNLERRDRLVAIALELADLKKKQVA